MILRIAMMLYFAMSAVPVLATDKPAVISGSSYYVVDGDTIHLEGQEVRLFGIDAPEISQTCIGAEGGSWACGLRARDMLVGILSSQRQVSCAIMGHDRYGRILGRCYAGPIETGIDVQKALVAGGFAVAEFTKDYRQDEKQAKRQKNGFWAGEFLRPKKYRKR
jgi:endonuclease YncB( thermonuclease family)